MIPDESEQRLGQGDALGLRNDVKQLRDFVRRLRGEQGKRKTEATLAFHVDREKVRARCHRYPQLAAAEAAIAKMRGECSKDSAADPAVAGLAAVSEHGVGFVNDDDDGAECANGGENAGLLAFGIADPFAAKVTEFHDGQSAFAGETVDEE